MELKRLVKARGVSGNESGVRAIIREIAEPLTDSIIVDRLGNLFAVKEGRAPHVMVCAHMDEVGLIVIGFSDSGLIAYEPVGAVDPRVVVSKKVRVGKDAIQGVIGAKAIHQQLPEERGRVLKHSELFIDIGADDADSAKKLVKIGDYVTFDSPYIEFGDDMISCRALDDRVGCASMLEVMKEELPVKVTFAFTVQEEVGLRGAHAAGYSTKPDICIVLEGTTAGDLGIEEGENPICRAGGGVAISFMDNSSIAHKGLFDAMRDIATKNNIPWQIKTGIAGGNDAGAVQQKNGGIPTVVLSVPCRNIHSPAGVACLKDIEAQAALLKAYLMAGAPRVNA